MQQYQVPDSRLLLENKPANQSKGMIERNNCNGSNGLYETINEMETYYNADFVPRKPNARAQYRNHLQLLLFICLAIGSVFLVFGIHKIQTHENISANTTETAISSHPNLQETLRTDKSVMHSSTTNNFEIIDQQTGLKTTRKPREARVTVDNSSGVSVVLDSLGMQDYMTPNSRSRPLPSLPGSSSNLELNDRNPRQTLLDENDYGRIFDNYNAPVPVPAPLPKSAPKRNCSSNIAVVLLIVLIVLLVYYGSRTLVPASTTPTFITPTTSSANPTIDSSPKCDPGYAYYEDTDHCYKVSIFGVKFAKAKAACESERAHLASIHSKAENNFLNWLYNTQIANYNKDAEKTEERRSVWLGLVFLDGKWGWTDGTPLDYDYWASNEPNLMENHEFYTEMVVHQFPKWSPNADPWNNVPDYVLLAYFCKKPSKQLELKRKWEFTTITMPDVKPEVCSPGYKFLVETGYCYKVFESKSKFDQADRVCKSDQANLASIHTKEENRLLADMSRSSSETFSSMARNRRLTEQKEVLIGLQYINGTWEWTDGTDVNFENWAKDQPDRLETEVVTTLVTSKIAEWNPDGQFWNNIKPASTQRAFICKKGKLESGR